MQVLTLAQIKSGQVGLVEHDNRKCLCFYWSAPGAKDGAAVIFPEPVIIGSRRHHCALLNESEVEYWPEAVIMENWVIAPVFASLEYGHEIPEKALVVLREGFTVALQGNSFGLSKLYVDIRTGERAEKHNADGYWYFRKWQIVIPNPVDQRVNEPIFSVDL